MFEIECDDGVFLWGLELRVEHRRSSRSRGSKSLKVDGDMHSKNLGGRRVKNRGDGFIEDLQKKKNQILTWKLTLGVMKVEGVQKIRN